MTECKMNNLVERLHSLKVERLFNINKPFNCRNNAFTLAEGATHVETCNGYRKAAFTLAEVLITLGVIGVVAAITMPMLITNINDRANSERHANIAYKITQAMEQMRAHGKLTAYDSTSAFVDELQKYLKITKRCDADHIAQCWPTETVIDANGDEYNVADCKKRKHLLAGSTSDDDNVGLILADGASVILTYDTSAAPMDVGDKVLASKKSLPVGKNKTQEFVYTMNVAAPIDFVTDVNGKKGPNSETRDNKYYDIRQFKIAQFTTPESSAPICESGSQGCLKIAGTGSTWSPVNCSSSASGTDDYANYCGPTPSGSSTDYWAGAKKLCAEAGMTLPTISQLTDEIYPNRANYTQLTAYQSYGWFWASEEYQSGPQSIAQGADFGIGNGKPNAAGKSNPGVNSVVLCVN